MSLMDIYPTLAELTVFDPPAHLDGRSLVPQFRNPEAETEPVVSSYKFIWTENPIIGHAVRSKRYRYIYYPDINLEELYDHEVDPNEWDNVAYKKENRTIVEDHRQVLLNLAPDLAWAERGPKGYSVDADGNVRKDDYVAVE